MEVVVAGGLGIGLGVTWIASLVIPANRSFSISIADFLDPEVSKIGIVLDVSEVFSDGVRKLLGGIRCGANVDFSEGLSRCCSIVL